MVLRRIFGAKGEEVTGHRRKLHSENIHNLCSSPNTRMIKLYSKCSPSTGVLMALFA
jgi:hypothetical protein